MELTSQADVIAHFLSGNAQVFQGVCIFWIGACFPRLADFVPQFRDLREHFHRFFRVFDRCCHSVLRSELLHMPSSPLAKLRL